jgi:hypothetical protein
MGRFSQLISSRRARRLGVSALAGTALLAFAGCTAAPVPPVGVDTGGATPVTTPSSQPEKLTDLGRDLRSYTNLAGDQVVVLPNGTYTAGTVSAPHAATTGTDKGWLVLKAQSQDGVVVDLSKAPLTLDSTTSRILFVGFKFVNGSVFAYGSNLAFWYTDHSFPANVWSAQAKDPSHPEAGLYRAPRTVYTNNPSSHDVAFYGADIHDTGTGFMVSGSHGTHIEGAQLSNFSDMGLDPQDVVHPDAIGGTSGNFDGLNVSYTWIKGRVMIEDGAGNGGSTGGQVSNLNFSHTWMSNSPSAGVQFVSSRTITPRGIFGQFNDVHIWAPKNGYARMDTVDGKVSYTPNTVPSRIDVTQTQVVTSAPSTDTATLNAENPALQWRAAHAYDNWMYAIH